MVSSILSKRPDLYQSVADWNSYSKPKESRKERRRALLAAPKLGCSLLNGSGTEVSGLPRLAASISLLGTLSGTLRSPSMSSEKQNSRVGISLRRLKAWRTMVVRTTSPKVPICGRPAGPEPVSNSTYPLAGALPPVRATSLRASSNGHARAASARERSIWDMERAKLGAAAICVNAGRGPKCRATMNKSPLTLAFGGLLAMAAGIGIGRFVYTPILPPMVEALSLSKAEAGLIDSANFVGLLACAPLAAVRLPGSRRTWLLAGLALNAICLAAMAVTTSLALFLLLRLLAGVASAFCLIFSSALVLDRLAAPGPRRLSAPHFSGGGR